MKTKFIEYINEETINFYYKGYQCLKNLDKGPGEQGLWIIPELYYRNFANNIEKGFETVSMIQCREAIDEWELFSNKIKNIKD